MLRFCPSCSRAVTRNTSVFPIQFRCVCGISFDGDPKDALIGVKTIHSDESVGQYRRLINSAPHDPVNQKVLKTCSKCGLDYMTQTLLGKNDVVMWGCTCGNRVARTST